MRSGAVRFGGFLIFVGVFVLSLEYVNWAAFEPAQRANFVIAGGIALLIAFGLALGSRSHFLDEFLHLLALAIGATILGLFVSGSGAGDWVSLAGPVRADKTLSFDGSFSSDAAMPSITLQLTNGDATVQTWDRESYQIIVHARARGWSQSEAEEALAKAKLQPEILDTSITFTVPREPLSLSRVEADVEVFLPKDHFYELRLETLNGSLGLTTIHATRVFLKTLNGRITLGDVTAQQSATLETLNGRISGRLATGEGTASTANGEIKLILGSVSGTYHVSALNGRIDLQVPEDPQNEIGYSISARTWSGSVTIGLPNFISSEQEQERRRVEGSTSNFTSASTKITIQANTTNGSIEIR
ncbi:MAG: hypothetical protein A2Z21_04310 [Candidatus Fraserbacteria bacterium RBG_16_55_9]|uniref:DUF4097 domain-containing protein n=1 Tax=Fraserbacteria sp. (strain RBG_16_55_9) TaxID=1817864 RepID=A0A1F5UP32_FRAXR|nr:MAG: hypothetical protein A2Z21_04310 [Candidatus Fraserbacteria bacterium RBG_16_55_9]